MNRLFLILLFVIGLISCKTIPPAEEVKDYEVENINKTGAEGTVTFKVWCYGKNTDEAVSKAKYSAVHAVLFRGIPGTNFESPMVTDIKIQEKKKEYFDVFFATNGKYINFVTLSNDGSIGVGDRLKVGKQYKVGTIVQVNHSELRKEMEKSGIIRKFGY